MSTDSDIKRFAEEYFGVSDDLLIAAIMSSPSSQKQEQIAEKIVKSYELRAKARLLLSEINLEDIFKI